MAERRAIKSTIWDDTWFGRLSPFEMVVWIGLFSKCADDQGRVQDDPALIRSKLFPYQDIALSSIETAMGMFEGHIIRYKKGERLAQLVRWFDNQPMQYAVPSNFPPPDGWVDRYRTNYKGAYIVWNWDGQPNNQLGSLLWEGLSKLERSSSWVSYLGRLNYNPNPTPNPNPKKEEAAEPPEDSDLSRMSVFIANLLHVQENNGGPDVWYAALRKIKEMGATETHIRHAFLSLKTGNKNYTVVGPQSLINAISNVMQLEDAQREKKNGNGHVKPARILTDALGRQIEALP